MAPARAHAPAANGKAGQVRSDPDFDLHELGDLSAELKRLSAVNQELLGQGPTAPLPRPAATDEASARLRGDNAELRARVADLEKRLAAASSEDVWAERQREYEALLEEKSEVIRSLHLKVHDLQEHLQHSPRASAGSAADGEDLMRLRDELEQQRRQLQDDEEALMGQMRQMELALSRDRAELARQRQEYLRLQADVNREIDQASRDPGLRERLQSLRRPAQDDPKKDTPKPQLTPVEALARPSNERPSGFFRRLFG